VTPGLLLALEGLDGSGKSTLANKLTIEIKALGREVALFKEPTTGPIGKKLRRLIQEGRPEGLDPEAELELFLADRAFDVAENVNPALHAGKVVIMDRYILSCVSCQGALGLDPELILKKNSVFPWPYATLLLDVSPETSFQRIKNRRGDKSAADFEDAGYLTKVHAILNDLEKFSLPGVYRLNGEKSLENLTIEAMKIVRNLLSQKA
jgi:dTMP kinase